jgi:hypothetical protein
MQAHTQIHLPVVAITAVPLLVPLLVPPHMTSLAGSCNGSQLKPNNKVVTAPHLPVVAVIAGPLLVPLLLLLHHMTSLCWPLPRQLAESKRDMRALSNPNNTQLTMPHLPVVAFVVVPLMVPLLLQPHMRALSNPNNTQLTVPHLPVVAVVAVPLLVPLLMKCLS